ncbi:MAG: hypothetical protein ACRC7R_00225 [Sarcina sp.]
MDKTEMLLGYDSTHFESKFNDNYKRISIFMYNYFKSTLGDRVAGMNVEENVLFAWSYYFLTIADDSKELGNNIMVNMRKHFDYMMSSEDKVQIKGERQDGQLLLLDETFCRIWFKTSICSMIGYLYGNEKVKESLEYLDENYFSKNNQYRTLMLHEMDKEKQDIELNIKQNI